MDCSIEHRLTKQWLADNPYESVLPKGYKIKFGKRGLFLKYDSIDHAEKKNMFVIRETGISLPFGYCNDIWEAIKASLLPNDEIWRYGSDGGEAILFVRENSIFKEMTLSCF